MKSNEGYLPCNLYFVLDKKAILLQLSEDLSYNCKKLNFTKECAFKWPRFVFIFINNTQYIVELGKYFSNTYNITDNFAGIWSPVIIYIFKKDFDKCQFRK